MAYIKTFVHISFFLFISVSLSSCVFSSSSEKDNRVISINENLVQTSDKFQLEFSEICIGNKIGNKAIYGTDNRTSSCSSNLKSIDYRKMKAVAMLVDSKQVQFVEVVEGKKIYKIISSTLGEHIHAISGHRACPTMKYVEEKNPGFCSGFLINESGRSDELVTAGHCLEGRSKDSTKVIFTIAADEREVTSKNPLYEQEIFVTEDQIFDINSHSKFYSDVTVAKLDREILGVDALEVSRNDSFTIGSELQIMGHPVGLMMKIAEGQVIADDSYSASIIAHIASFGGNSGSPVFDKETGLVAGILVSGQEDFELSQDLSSACVTDKIYNKNDAGGERILKLGKIFY